ncbi:sugar kinase [Hyphomicrobiales bacterium BP6-180914]|uniref:Sugar kinase n=2 Tax=Lichenifustis flavocetrariae TaxID=2949735 RepID=A0AA42CIK6_9HYPH|nr:sugar kinase [Lichenifustis flavocetrariae]
MEFAEASGQEGSVMRLGYGGDVSNVAIAAARQGLSAGMIGAVGDDAFGGKLQALWDREGVDRRHVLRPGGSRTGLYFITYEAAGHVFSYARDGSAASRYTPADLPTADIAAARLFHASAISQGIGLGPCDATFEAIHLAREKGVSISYDTNLRLKLWPLDRARAIIHATAALADILRPGLDDARLLTGRQTPDAIADFYLGLGPRIVVLTLGSEGCLVATPARREVIPCLPVAFVDASGAGDTFTGAFLAEYARTGDEFASARYANVAAALKTRGIGAIEPIPRRAEVEAVLSGEPA